MNRLEVIIFKRISSRDIGTYSLISYGRHIGSKDFRILLIFVINLMFHKSSVEGKEVAWLI